MKLQRPVVISLPDSYCGNDRMCADGGEQIFSFFLVVALVGLGVLLGSYLAQPTTKRRK